MFDCKSCLRLEEEVKFLRDQVKSLTDRLVVLTNPSALQALSLPVSNPDDFYGTSQNDEVYEYNAYGQKLLVKRENG